MSATNLDKIGRRAVRVLKRRIRVSIGMVGTRRRGLQFELPNYIFMPRLQKNSVVIDVGCAANPELALLAMRSFGAKVVAVDPTNKHGASLKALEAANPTRFTYLPLAVGAQNAKLTFHESVEKDSGSLLGDHQNLVAGEFLDYAVECVTLPVLRERTGCAVVDLLKLDLEGAEFELICQSTSESFQGLRQIFVEFHHDQVERYSKLDTRACVRIMQSYGYRSFSRDGTNYLFFVDG